MLGMTEFLNCSLENVALFRMHGDISTVIAVSAESPNQETKPTDSHTESKQDDRSLVSSATHSEFPWHLRCQDSAKVTFQAILLSLSTPLSPEGVISSALIYSQICQ